MVAFTLNAFLTIALFCVQNVFASRILFVPAHNIHSHTKSMYPVAELLARDGHDVVVLQLLRKETFNETCAGRNIVDKRIWAPAVPPGDPTDDENFWEILWTPTALRPPAIFWAWVTGARVCKDLLHEPEAESQFLDVIREHWDLVVVDDLFASCGIIAASLIKAPWIVLSTTFMQYTRVLDFKGVQPSPSYVPATMVYDRFDATKFTHRLLSVWEYFLDVASGYSLEYFLPPFMDHPLARNSSVAQFQKDSVLAMGCLPMELDYGKPLSHDVIDYDNDCPSVKSELPDAYAQFVEDPRSKGTIVMSLGHYADWDNAPVGVMDAFATAFEELKDYRIIWQFVSLTHRTKPNVGSNVMVTEWIPQIPLLAHRKTLLFITHAGMKSVKETLCFDTPIIGMPMFAEQGRNTAMAMNKGFGLYLDKTSADKKTILTAIRTIINDHSFKLNAKKLNAYLNDKILNPTHVAKFWMNFVLKHKNVDRLKKHLSQKRTDSFLQSTFFEASMAFALIMFCALPVLT